MEIYNEQLRDLLSTSNSSLAVMEDPEKGIIIPELIEKTIECSKDANDLIFQGNCKRVSAATSYNQYSSRSHAIFQVNLEIKQHNSTEHCFSKLYLVDLAGSEKGNGAEGKGQKCMEGSKINQSLLALGNCINILSDRSKYGAYVPYRDSKLTRLLKDSLGGNACTMMIACISLNPQCFDETINTLKYAQRAKRITHKVYRNIRSSAHSNYQSIIDSLKGEIKYLRTQLNVPVGISMPIISKNISHNDDIKSIDEQLRKTQETKSKLEYELNKTKSQAKQEQESPNTNDALNSISQNLLSNLEENREIKQGMLELEQLKAANEGSLAKLKQIVNSNCNNEQMSKTKQEISNLMHNMESNLQIYQGLRSALDENNFQKQSLQEKITKIENGKRKDMLELQINIRMLKLQKLDLEMENLCIKKENIYANQIKSQQQHQVNQIKEELIKVENSLKSTQLKLQRSNSIIDKQACELVKLKGSANTERSKSLNRYTLRKNCKLKLLKKGVFDKCFKKMMSRQDKLECAKGKSLVVSSSDDECESTNKHAVKFIAPIKKENNIIHIKLTDIINKSNSEVKAKNEPMITPVKDDESKKDSINKLLNYISKTNVCKKNTIAEYIEMRVNTMAPVSNSRPRRLQELRTLYKIKKEKENEQNSCSLAE